MNVTTGVLEKIYRTAFYAAVIGLMTALFLPWIIVDAFGEIMFLNHITLYQEQTVEHELNYISRLITISSVGFWGVIIFTIGGFIGLGYRKIEEITRSCYFMIGSIPLLCCSVVALVPNILIWLEILSHDFIYRHAFNFIPLIMSVVIVVSSSLLVALVGKRSLHEVLVFHSGKKENSIVEDEEHETIKEDTSREVDGSVEDHKCPRCEVNLEGKELICPECRENISKRCPVCKKLISMFTDRCPMCGFIHDES